VARFYHVDLEYPGGMSKYNIYIWAVLIKLQMIIHCNAQKSDIVDKWHSWASDIIVIMASD